MRLSSLGRDFSPASVKGGLLGIVAFVIRQSKEGEPFVASCVMAASFSANLFELRHKEAACIAEMRVKAGALPDFTAEFLTLPLFHTMLVF